MGYDDAQLCGSTRRNKYSITAQSANILLGNDDTMSFDTSRMNNQSFTTPSAHVFLVDNDAQSFENTQNKSQFPCIKCPYFVRIWFTTISTQEQNS